MEDPTSFQSKNDDGPLGTIFSEIERALQAGLFYAAISSVLTIPDICAALESEDGIASGAKYRSWYDKHLSQYFPNLTAEDCYSLRCGVLHQGRMGLRKSSYARVIFTVPNNNGNKFHNCIFDDALQFDSIQFCHDIINIARKWSDEVKYNVNFMNNGPKVLRLRPDGLDPYVVGIPLIA